MANLKKVIYINEEDYSTLINGDSLVIDGTTYTYEENALYVIKNAGPPEYAETAGYATNAGTSQVAVTDASGNNIAATYEKKPLIIEVNESDSGTTLEQGTYDSITQALAQSRQVILKLTRDNDDNEILYLPLLIDYTVTDNIYQFIVWYNTYTSYKAEINSHDEFYYVTNTLAEDDVVVHKAETETITGNKTFTGTVSLGSKATATTPATTDNDTSVATTAFVHKVVNAIPEIITGHIVGRMHRDNVSGTGNLTITGASGEGFNPNGITTAGKYIVVVYSWSDTKTFGYNISFGSNNYTLNTTDGTISDKRELTVSTGALWSGAVTTAVNAGTTIIVEIYKAEKITQTLSVGTVALTNLYNDLDGKPTISSSTSSTSTTDIASSKAVKSAYDHGGVQSVNGKTGNVNLTLGDTNVIESISVNGVAQTITNKNVDITIEAPEGELSENYAISELENENLTLAAGDTFETAFSKIEKAIIDNEETVAGALNDLNERLLDINIPASVSDLTDDVGIVKSVTINGNNHTPVDGIVDLGTISGSGTGDTNVIEAVKVNGTALTPDANKAVNVIVPTKTSDLTNDSNFTTLSEVTQTIVNSAPTTLDTLNELAAALGNDANFATTVATQIGQKYTKPSTGIPASDLANGVIPDVPVQSVNGQTGAVTINVGVTSFNGSTGAVTYTPPVTSVNGQTGEVNLSIPSKTSDLTNDSKFIQDKGGNDLNLNTSVIDGAFSNEDIVLTCNNHNAAVNVNPGGIDIISNWDGSSSGVNNNGTGSVNINTSQGKAYYNNKEIATVDQIPAAVTEDTVYGWGFTKDHGTYSKPLGGIPKTDLASAVQTSLGKADTAIQGVKVNGTSVTPDSNKIVDITIPEGELSNNYEPSSLDNDNLSLSAGDTYEEAFSKLEKTINDNEKITAAALTDLDGRIPTKTSDLTNDSGFITEAPVTSVNGQTGAVTLTIPAAVTESTVAGWGFTKNAGTITGITMNGSSKGTSGVVDLGTVLTSFTETDPTVPAWAKAVNKPTYTATEVGALPDTTVIPAAPGTLNTTATTAQSTSSSEALSGNITLHKVAKTGTYNDLIGKPTIPAAQVQSDWNATSGMGVILNKPTIPTVNNATLTIQKNGTTVNTFTANASSNVTANIQVNELPTVSSSDNGKILQVVNGAWALVTPTSIYSGTSAPDNSTGNDGDLYLQTS